MLGSARSAFNYRPPAGVVLPSAMAAYSFSEGSGTTSADSSGNGHTLTMNTATFTTGHTGGGITNTAATIGASTNLVPPTAAITMMAWIQALDLTASTSHFAFGFIDSTSGSGRTIAAIYTERADFPPNNVLQCDLRINDTLSGVSGGAMTLNTWTHCAFTYDGTNIRVYVNGSLITTSGSLPGTITTADKFNVAGWTTTSQYDTDVIIDDVRVFNSALSQAQITLAMNTPVS